MIIVLARLPTEFSAGSPGEQTATMVIQHLPNDPPRLNGKGHTVMKWNPELARRLRKWLVAPTLLLAVLAMSGCQALSYYGQAIKGKYQIVTRQERIEKLLAGHNLVLAFDGLAVI